MKKNPDITRLDTLIEKEFGSTGTHTRDEFERGYEAFKLGILIRQARKNAKMTQQDLAEKTGTKRTYISRIENDASDIRLSTLQRIIEIGLGGKLEINFRIA